ncbi:MAG: metal-dependent hydrolase [Candidatus Promineifilaceae bacterium]|nr:metal-dependent hydrolase [Candidatus Promineifilaceae bacterium]
MTVSFTWHGHATFTIDIDGTKVVVDPFFAPNNPAAQVSAEDVAADFILQTHGHGDHSADTVALAKRTGAQVIANFEICNWISAQGHDNVWAMNTGGAYDFPFGRVKMTYALHSSGLPDGSYGGNPGGFVIFLPECNIYVAGDTALYSDMRFVGNLGIDLAIIPTGDNFTMGPEDALAALDFLSPNYVIPCHYNTWPPIEQDMNAWAKKVEVLTDVTPVVLDVEGSFSL